MFPSLNGIVFYLLALSISTQGNRIRRQTNCKNSQFTCSNGQCIPSYNVCDGVKDCADGSDETEATCKKLNIRCPSNAFKCSYGACVDRNLRCDQKQDCADGSDETGCSACPSGKFKCADGQCINRYSICDGDKDCKDGSDETKHLCKDLKCPSNSFRCEYGACLEQEVRCDGIVDCLDGSDEVCGFLTPTASPPLANNPADDRVPAGGCRLPAHPRHGEYTSTCSVGDQRAACRNTPGAPVSANWLLKYSCHANYHLNDDSHFSVCENGQWKRPLDCIKLCKPLVSLSVDVRCAYFGVDVSCHESMRPNTTATTRCKQHYHYRDKYPPDYSYLTCGSDGEWDYELFSCVPDCGVPLKPGDLTALVNHGVKTRRGEFPWLAGLYMRKMPNGTIIKNWEQLCGGTLITPHIVLTAAHCLDYKSTFGVLKPEDVKVGLGKYYRNYREIEPSSVISDVREIVIPDNYAGQASLFALDIALLDLVNSVEVTAHIMPACVDWQNHNILLDQWVGQVAGWGRTENGTSSGVILAANLTFIDNKKCILSVPPSYKRFITHDKFCAESQHGEQADRGDSGGGFTVVQNNLHFVIGIVSTKIPDQSKYAMFTNISNPEHNDWLEKQKKRLDKFHRHS